MRKSDRHSENEGVFTVGICQHATWRASRKLRAIGAVFERQVDSEIDGYPELIGLGMVLSDLSDELDTVADSLKCSTPKAGSEAPGVAG